MKINNILDIGDLPKNPKKKKKKILKFKTKKKESLISQEKDLKKIYILYETIIWSLLICSIVLISLYFPTQIDIFLTVGMIQLFLVPIIFYLRNKINIKLETIKEQINTLKT